MTLLLKCCQVLILSNLKTLLKKNKNYCSFQKSNTQKDYEIKFYNFN